MFWFAIIFVVAFAIAYATMPKPKEPQLGTVESPTAEEGRAIPVLFGTRWIKQTNVVWYGDIKTEAVRKKGGKK
jgi:hypothetical protein